MHRIVILGGAGDMAGIAARWLAELRQDVTIVLADRDLPKAQSRAKLLGPLFTAESVDLFEPRRLREVVGGARLVVNATGPYYRTGRPVLEAAIDCRADYIDFGDDVESADLMLGLDRAARDGGVTALIGAGIAPGVVNVVARELSSRLDVADSVQLAWVTGSTPRRPGQEPGGRAVIEHMLHSCIGITFTVEDGRRRVIPAFRRSGRLAFPAPLGECRVYDIGHAELVTIPRFLPGITRVRCQGAVHPATLNGLFQGLAAGVASGQIGWDDAIAFVMALEQGANGMGPCLRSSLSGILRQWLRRELRWRDIADLANLVRGMPSPESLGGLYVRVEGSRGGARAAWLARTAIVQSAESGGMDEVTGRPLALFAHLMLEGKIHRPGVVAPEVAVAPSDLRALLLATNYPGAEQLFAPESVPARDG